MWGPQMFGEKELYLFQPFGVHFSWKVAKFDTDTPGYRSL